MGFWEEQAEREAVQLQEERLPQNAPTECAGCGVVSVEVILGVCPECFS